MSLVKLLLCIGIVYGAFHFWNLRQDRDTGEAAESPGEFVALPAPSNHDARTVIVLATENCPLESAQRADALAKALAKRNIPYTRAHSAEFTLRPQDADVVPLLNSVMRGPLPIVFVNGRAKANPSLDEVVAEYGGGFRR